MDDPFPDAVGPLHAAAPEILSRLLSVDTDAAELFAEQTYRERFRLRYDRWRAYGDPWEEYVTGIVEGTGLRVLTGDATRYASVDGLDPAFVRIKADQLRAGPPGEVYLDRFPPRGSLALPVDTVDRVSLEEKRSLLQAAVDAALSQAPRLRDLEVEFQGTTRQTYVASTDERPTFAASSLVGIRVEATFERGERHFHVYAIGGGTGGIGQFILSPPEQISRACVKRMQTSLQARPLSGSMGSVPVIIEGGWGGVWLHEALGHLLEADTPGSYGADRIGDRIAPEHVTIVDDGTFEDGRGTALFDDEGCPMQRTVLVEAGELRNVMSDRLQSRRMGIPRTGNGRRESHRSEPIVRMTNLLLEGGTATREALVADVAKGLYVRTIGTGKVYPSEDRYAFEVLEGSLIENGRLTMPVARLQISGRPSQMLESIAGIADDFRVDSARGMCSKAGQIVPVSVGMPTVMVRNLTVTALS
jgi:TldD protein